MKVSGAPRWSLKRGRTVMTLVRTPNPLIHCVLTTHMQGGQGASPDMDPDDFGDAAPILDTPGDAHSPQRIDFENGECGRFTFQKATPLHLNVSELPFTRNKHRTLSAKVKKHTALHVQRADHAGASFLPPFWV